ncbi:hypothetical protein IXO278_20660, partial [Xanthomonas oryzae pv. oryzae]
MALLPRFRFKPHQHQPRTGEHEEGQHEQQEAEQDQAGLVQAVALGETMAVSFIIGEPFRLSSSIFAPGPTISAAIASEFAESAGLHPCGLILLGLLLVVVVRVC